MLFLLQDKSSQGAEALHWRGDAFAGDAGAVELVNPNSCQDLEAVKRETEGKGARLRPDGRVRACALVVVVKLEFRPRSRCVSLSLSLSISRSLSHRNSAAFTCYGIWRYRDYGYRRLVVACRRERPEKSSHTGLHYVSDHTQFFILPTRR